MKLNLWFNPVDEVCSKASPTASQRRMLDEKGAMSSLMCIYFLSAPWVFPAQFGCHHYVDFLKLLWYLDFFTHDNLSTYLYL